MTLPIVGKIEIPKSKFHSLLEKRNPEAPLWLVDLYYDVGPSWNIRADVLLSQNFHETDFLKSWWCQAPRRNMAGIGVTGESIKSLGELPTVQPKDDWTYDPDKQMYFRGLSFKDYVTAVEAHYAHMSAYVYPNEINMASYYNPRWQLARKRYLNNRWPLAKVMTDLNGRWAVPGTTYGQTIETIFTSAKNLK